MLTEQDYLCADNFGHYIFLLPQTIPLRGQAGPKAYKVLFSVFLHQHRALSINVSDGGSNHAANIRGLFD